ncbi:hypothetical protein QAD02_023380 [Eretmocerus hayati]|uniref:Uncharacterized protein n=1 Tax=Eretmocerus hayati TaxID=131215 RepID=A0ACC2PXC2_9HYME|nr:hypothetical protein QAD02_023380 [Eretmocerus hayati]
MRSARLVFALCVSVTYLVKITSLPFNYGDRKLANDRSQKRGREKKLAQLFGDSFDIDVPDFIQLVSKHGYPAEEHLVITVDGYKLKIHRMPGSPTQPKAPGKPIIYFQHGLLASSDSWVLYGPDRDLTFMMADAGFDVWVGNIRGNTYSRSHVVYRPDYDPKFWDYSWHEMGIYDIPSVIDYILDRTGEQSLAYVGHSMGTTMSYVMLSMKPEYNDKIWLAISLAPIAFWTAPPTPMIKLLRSQGQSLRTLLYAFGVHELLPRTKEVMQLLYTMCGDKSPIQPLCLDVMWLSFGYNPEQLNMDLIPTLLSIFPAGTSRRTVEHYLQNVAAGDFRMFDYGRQQNMERYGQTEPPSYNLKNIRTSVALYYGANDAFAPAKNPLKLAEHLPNVAVVKCIDNDFFNHMDFIIAEDIKSRLNDPILDMVVKSLELRNTD